MRRRHAFRHIEWRTQEFFDVELLTCQRTLEQVRSTQDADHVLQPITTDDDARKGRFGNTGADHLFRLVEVQFVNIVAVRHDRGDTLLVEAQDVGDNRLFALVEDTGLGPLLHQHVDFIVGHWRFFTAFGTDQLQHHAR